ncbi:MAG: hypothetical protein A2V83_07820 [Nitrospirae bacterium RBG_16_64_22]|nr:MAG: hypothetical protein A2V83_07820 [Nitrospirae bacterium RBG_16_64_22]
MREIVDRAGRWVASHRVLVTIPAVVLLFALARPSMGSILGGAILVLFGETLRVWSSGHIEKNKALAVGGPYRFTRNPLYLGNSLLGLGFAVMSGRYALIALFPVLFYLVYAPVIRDEEEVLRKRFGSLFDDMCRRVPKFFPRWPRRPSPGEGGGRFSWSLVWKHREPVTWAGLAAGIGLMVLCGWGSL